MKKLLIGMLALFFSSASFSYAQGPVNLCFTTNGTNCVPAIQASNSVVINIGTGTIQLVPLVAGKRIYIASWDVIASATTTIALVYGTGTNCGTGTTFLAGPYSLVAQAGLSKASGLGPVLFVPAGNALCIVNNTGTAGGSLSYAQF